MEHDPAALPPDVREALQRVLEMAVWYGLKWTRDIDAVALVRTHFNLTEGGDA